MSQSVEAVADASWRDLLEQDELDWELGSIDDRAAALHFLARFEGCFCLYSRADQQLYTQYRFVIPENDEQPVMVLLPDDGSDDSVRDLPLDAVVDTGITVFPGECVGASGLYLKIPARNRLVGSREVPFQVGLKKLVNRYLTLGHDFLPVLVREELDDFEQGMPALTLHTLDVSQLSEVPAIDVVQIREVIVKNLVRLYR
ncbi:hypothetical protein [Kistimonas asteriae]|uniref:hypothetical protein n=1 Tax=Kistimonas asteriae TaxID=517724 RepID=UPI001BA904AF|nr:hypothetical protein [Kistimonas asteriae]